MVAARGNLTADLDRLLMVPLAILCRWHGVCKVITGCMRLSKLVLLVLLFVLAQALTIVTAICQEQGEKVNEPKDLIPKAQIMVIALGPVPARKYSNNNKRGDAAMLLPAIGEVPPSQLYYKAEDTYSTAPSKWRPFRIAFNNNSVMCDIRAGRDFLLYRKLASRYELYVVIPAGGVGTKRVVLLTSASLSSNPATPWNEKPKLTIVAMESASLRDKQFAIKNLSKIDVLHAFDQKVANVRPGQLIAYRRNRKGVLYHLAARYGSERKMIYNMAVHFERDSTLHLYVLYDAIPATNAGRLVGVFRMVL